MSLMDPQFFPEGRVSNPSNGRSEYCSNSAAIAFSGLDRYISLPSWMHWSNGSLFGNF